MKIRTGFVSNSSSSSFICEVCGNVEAGYDLSMEDAGMYECENGHEICEHHIAKSSPENTLKVFEEQKIKVLNYADKEKVEEFIKDEIQEKIDNKTLGLDDINYFLDEFNRESLRYSLPHELCPICNLENIKDSDMLAYILKAHNILSGDIKNEITEQFENYKALQEYLKGE